MNYRPILVALAVFAIFVLAIAGVFVAISESYSANERTWETNETISEVSANTTYAAQPAHVPNAYHDDEVVTNGSGTQLEEGVDYSWNTSTGELTFQNSTTVADSTSATLQYSYDGHMQGAADVWGVQTGLAPLIPYLVLVFAAFFVIVLMVVAAGVLLNNNAMFR